MKNIVLISFILFSYIMKGQDPSFSQFDLNMNYSNPAFTGYEGKTRFLLHSRNQWNRINENFNNSIFEFSSRFRLNKNSRKRKTSWCFGVSLISEDLEVLPQIGNSVFLKRTDIYIYPFTLEMKISKNEYISASPLNVSFRKYGLSSSSLIFTDMINDYDNVIADPSFSYSTFNDGRWGVTMSSGLIYTRHGKFNNNKRNRFNIGFAGNLITDYESLLGTNTADSKIPQKITLHSEWYSAIPSWRRPFIPYYRNMMKHETYFKDGKSIFSKTEIGGTIFLNNTGVELGTILRINNYQDNGKAQTWIPILRYRLNSGKNLYIISFSYDGNIASSNELLQFVSTGTTYELGFTIYVGSGRNKNQDCAAFDIMDENPLYQDVLKKGMFNHRNGNKNFKR